MTPGQRAAARRREEAGEAPPGAEPRCPVLIVGLGNPGPEYANTRHNVGAWCVRLLAERHGARLERTGRVDTATVVVDGRPLHLARPRAYVNESGGPVAGEARRLHVDRSLILVVYDELDLPLGQVRIRPHGGHGGHNGMRSLISALGGGEFMRIRIGIDRPYDNGAPVRDPDRIAAWVLSAPSRSDRQVLDEAVALAADAILLATREGIDIAMNRYNPS